VPIRHLDLYRLSDADDLVELGIHEGLDEVVTVIEWGARFRSAIGERGLEVHLSIPDGRPNARVARLKGLGARGRELAQLAAGVGL
jgi:tRNA A37 threonylcarbamoyladenosine biosynthesis protein TsaE